MTGKEILQRLGYDNLSTTANEYIIAKDAYDLARKDAEDLNKTAIDTFECIDCMDTGTLYDAQGNRVGTCPCHY